MGHRLGKSIQCKEYNATAILTWTSMNKSLHEPELLALI